ncbi:hypothetical protein VTJ83DRAFT_1940 [Remersonia thermophila]|uniref:FAD/NAD(P)-binding domain-containing protein n=1 Tax=Remersonia thermophila TaxID=72144 RepID=A0ABR4DHK1_9PEZI
MHPLSRRCCSHLKSGFRTVFRTISRKHQHNPTDSPGLRPFRYNHTDSPLRFSLDDEEGPRRSAAIVVGGGPAGIAAVGKLLEVFPGGNITWVDQSFTGGTINQFLRGLPSYGTAGDYVAYAQTLPVIQKLWAVPNRNRHNAVKAMQALDPVRPCALSYVGDMLQLISDGLRKHARVQSVTGTVTLLARDPKTRVWTVAVDTTGVGTNPPLLSLRTPMVILCTGARPVVNTLPVQVSQLPLYTGLSRPHLTKILPPEEPRTIAVIGSGHSAVLVLRNLAHLASTTHPHLRIRWLTRSPHLTYASHVGDSPNGPVIANQYDGLTGKAAEFAREELDGDALATSPAGRFITRVGLPTVPGEPRPQNKDWAREQGDLEHPALVSGLKGCDFAIQAVGFARARLPELRPGVDAGTVALGTRPRTLMFNSETGSLYPAGADRMSAVGLFGAGSGFPEVVPTPEMVKKPRVGVLWFMMFVKKMAPMWALATRDGKFPEGFDPQGRTWFGGP